MTGLNLLPRMAQEMKERAEVLSKQEDAMRVGGLLVTGYHPWSPGCRQPCATQAGAVSPLAAGPRPQHAQVLLVYFFGCLS